MQRSGSRKMIVLDLGVELRKAAAASGGMKTFALSGEARGVLDPAHGMPELYEPRLPLLTLTEAHELLDVLAHFAATDHDWGAQARHFAAELAARIPSRGT